MARIAILSALAVGLRSAFIGLPNIQPITAMFFVAVLYLGLVDGLLIMALTMAISGFIFGFGPWVFNQILAFGVLMALWSLIAPRLSLVWQIALVINSIEFWSGSNPMASIGEVKKVKGENGNYLVETLENGYSITKEGETASMELIYDKDLNTWNVVAEGVSTELLQINNDGTAQMTLPNGEDLTVTLDAQGVSAARQATMVNTYYAAR